MNQIGQAANAEAPPPMGVRRNPPPLQEFEGKSLGYTGPAEVPPPLSNSYSASQEFKGYRTPSGWQGDSGLGSSPPQQAWDTYNSIPYPAQMVAGMVERSLTTRF
jgi:hypothetical protein